MKNIIYFLIGVLFFSNCTHRIVRTGYDNKANYGYCNVVIKKNIYLPDSIGVKVGEIKLGDNGFSVACNEGHAIDILREEACALDADLIVIRSENRPNFWSSCYRCSADFYQFNSPLFKNQMESDALYDKIQVKKRIANDRHKMMVMAFGSMAGGYLLGYFLFQ